MSNVQRSIVLAAALLLGVASSALAAPPSVTATAISGATNLSMDSGGSTLTRIVKVADVSIMSDGANGFSLSVTSGTLTKPGATPVPFQVALVDAAAPSPSASEFTMLPGTILTYAGIGSPEKALYIRYSLPVHQDPGTYSAQISLEIFEN
jgi:hypothetical protein